MKYSKEESQEALRKINEENIILDKIFKSKKRINELKSKLNKNAIEVKYI